MPDNFKIEEISDELKKVPATQYDVAVIRASLYEIQSHLQKIYNAIEVNKTVQNGSCSVHTTKTTNLETKTVELEKRVSDLETNSDKLNDVTDLDTRVNRLEKVMYMALGIVGFLQIAVPIATKLIWK